MTDNKDIVKGIRDLSLMFATMSEDKLKLTLFLVVTEMMRRDMGMSFDEFDKVLKK